MAATTESRASRAPFRRRLAAVLPPVAAAAALALGGCGGGGGEENVEDLLDKAFNKGFDSADVRLDVELQLEGLPAVERPLRIKATGPYRANKNKLASFDIDLELSAGGQPVRTGRLSTGDRLFIKFQDVYYEVPADQVRQNNRQVQRENRSRQALAGIGPDARKWLRDAKIEGDAEVAGVETTRVSGQLDVGATLRGLNEFASRASRALGPGAAPTPPRPLPKRILDDAEDIVKENPKFDVYVGKDDDVIRRISANLKFDVPERDRERLRGLERGRLELNLEFADIDGDQKIEAPANARPLSDLARSLGSTGTLGGIGGLPGGGRGGGADGGGAAPAPDPGAGPPAEAPPPPGTAGQPNPDDFRRYAECLDKADVRDTQALRDCNRVLS